MTALKTLRPTILVIALLLAAGALAIFALKKSETLSSRRAYLIGEIAKQDVVVPKKMSVIDPIATEAQRQAEAAKVPDVLLFDKNISGRAAENFREEFVSTHDKFLNAIERTFKTRTLTTNQLGSRFRKVFDAFHAKNKSYPVGIHEAESWALQPLDQNRINQMSARLRKVSERLIRPETFSATNLTLQVRIVPEQTLAPSLTLLKQPSRLVSRTNVVGLAKARNEVMSAFGIENSAVQKFMASHVEPNCAFAADLTRQFRAEETNDISAIVSFEAGQVVVRRGDVIDAKAKAALDELNLLSSSFPEKYGNQFGLWVSAIFCAILALMIGLMKLARRPRRNLVSAGNVVVLPSLATANDDLRASLVPHLARGLMGRFVRTLISQRSELLETQNAGTNQLTKIEQQLEQISVRLETRQALYEKRIVELENELATSEEENRELIRAKIHEARQNLEWAKTQVNKK